MNCTDYSVLLEKYLDGSLTTAEADLLRRHEDECPACAAQRRVLDGLQDNLTSLKNDIPPMPADFHQAWMTRVEEDAMENRERKNSPRFRPHWTRMLSTAAALVFVLGGTLLTRDSLAPRTADKMQNSTASIYGDYAVEESYDAGASNGIMLSTSYDGASADMTSGAVYTRSAKAAPTSDVAAAREQKIIRSASMTIGTQHYDESLSALRQLGEDAGGWVSYSSESVSGNGLRRAYLTLRIPTEQLDDYLAGTGNLGRVISKDESATDVTDSYYDTQARLDTQLALMARLQSLVTDAASLADLLALESQIADTQYMIDSLRSSLDSTDQQVNYATVDVNLREETAASDLTDSAKTFLDRLFGALETGLTAFVDFLQDMVIFLTAALPFMLIVAVVWIIVRLIRRRKK